MPTLRHTLLPNRWLSILICLMFVCLPLPSAMAQATTIRYVNHAATGANNGTSWANAYTRLELALAAAQPNDQIWIARGVYRPTTSTTDREASFVLKDGVALYGGFNGSETALNQRSIAGYRTILSGDIDKDDTTTDNLVLDPNNIRNNNSYHVIRANNLTNGARIDGLYITAGWANGSSDNANGAGILSVNSKITLANSSMLGNKANRGAVLYLSGGQAIISSTSLHNNEASLFGGAIHNNQGQLEISLSTFAQNNVTGIGVGGAIYSTNGSIIGDTVNFEQNSAAAGGAIQSNGSTISIEQALFTGNTASGNGGAINSSNSKLYLLDNDFYLNKSEGTNSSAGGGALYNTASSTTVMTDTFFSKNEGRNGGAIYNLNSTVIDQDGRGQENKARNEGGYIYNSGASMDLTGTVLVRNEAQVSGGAVRNTSTSLVSLRNTNLSDNKALTGNGGAIASNTGSVTLVNSFVRNNSLPATGTSNGGGLWNDQVNFTLTNVQLTGNVADYGAGMYNQASTVNITNATISSNYAYEGGGGMINGSASNVTVRNTVLWGNIPSIETSSDTNLTITYSMIENCVLAAWPFRCGTNGGKNLNPENPQFFDKPGTTHSPTSYGDYHLKASPASPLIDKGNDLFITEDEDISGETRKFGMVDIGAYEYQLYGVNISVEPAGKGSVTASPNQIAYYYKQNITLTASPNPGWIFEKWTGVTLNGNNPLTLSVEKTHTIVVHFRNLAPTVNAGSDQLVTGNTLVILNGSASDADPSQTISLTWSQISGPAVTLSNPNIAQPTFTVPNIATTLQFNLRATDNFGAFRDDIVEVTVVPVDGPPNQAPSANAGPDQQVQVNTTVTLDGSASSDPNPGQTLSYKWTQTAGPSVTLSSSTVAKPTFTAPNSATTLTFSLVVTDNLGAASSADTVIIRVLAPGQTPSYPVHLPFVRR